MPTRDSIDSRVKYGNRILSLLHMITFLAGALYPREKENIGFIFFTISSLFLVGSHIILQFTLMILSEFYVQYDIHLSSKEILKDSLDECRINLTKEKEQSILKIKEEYTQNIKAFEMTLTNLELANHTLKVVNRRLYNRLDHSSDEKNKKKKLVSDLLVKIENNNTNISEGDYIIMMDLLKKIYD